MVYVLLAVEPRTVYVLKSYTAFPKRISDIFIYLLHAKTFPQCWSNKSSIRLSAPGPESRAHGKYHNSCPKTWRHIHVRAHVLTRITVHKQNIKNLYKWNWNQMNWMDTIWYNNIYSTMHNIAYLICLPSGFQMSATRSTRSACSCLVTAGCAHFSRSASSELFCSTPAANTKHKVRNKKKHI